MRALILIVATLVIALVSGAAAIARDASVHVAATTEEVRGASGHHHRTTSSWSDDTDDDSDADDDGDDALAAPWAIVLAPMKTIPLAETSAFMSGSVLGPATAHDQLLERPPRSITL